MKHVPFHLHASLPSSPIMTPFVKINVIEYNEQHFFEKEGASIEDCLHHLDTPSMTWIQVYGVNDPSIVTAIGNQFKVHPLVLEDIVMTNQRAKLDVYDQQIFIVARLLYYKDHGGVATEQISLVLGPNYLISFVETKLHIFKPIIERLKQGNGNRLRKQGSDYLAYAILDSIVDQYFVVLEKMDDSFSKLEKEVSQSTIPHRTTALKIQQFKREMIALRKSVWPMREVINRFMQIDSNLVTPFTQVYLRDIYDHVIQAIDMIEGFRDVLGGLLDIYLSTINIRTNEIMKVLTIVSTIFVPLTFIASVYGMNFDRMPGLHQPWGYPGVIALMGAVAIGMVLYFHRKKWF